MNQDVQPGPAPRNRVAGAAEAAAVWLLAVAVVVAPLVLACAPEWPRLGLEAVMALATVLWAVSRPRSPVLMAIPVVVSLLFCMQIVPLPDSILFTIAPISGGAWKAETAIPASAWGSISIDPGATLVAIRRLFLGLATAVTVAALARSKTYRSVLIWSLAITGAVLVVGGLVFGPSQDATLLWGRVDLAGQLRKTYSASIPPVMSAGFGLREMVKVGDLQYTFISAGSGNGFFTYPYCNLFAGALAATLPVGMALWLAFAAGRVPAWLRWGVFGLVTLGSVWLAGIEAGSRGGGLALALAWICLAAIVSRDFWRERGLNVVIGRLVIAGLVLAALAVVLLWAGVFPDPWRRKFIAVLQAGRLGAAIIGFRMFSASPVLGTGFDTYQLLMPRYATERFIIFFAHNEYAQLLAEAGLLGMAFLGATAVALGRRFLRFWNDARGPYRVTNAGPWAAFVGLAAHSAVDWNFHLPANAFLGCVLVGLVSSSVPDPRAAWRDAERWTALRLVAALALVVTSVGFWGLLARDAVTVHHQRELLRAIEADRLSSRRRKPGDVELLRAALERCVAQAESDPANARLALSIGQGFLHLAQQPAAKTTHENPLAEADTWLTRARRLGPALQGVPQPLKP